MPSGCQVSPPVFRQMWVRERVGRISSSSGRVTGPENSEYSAWSLVSPLLQRTFEGTRLNSASRSALPPSLSRNHLGKRLAMPERGRLNPCRFSWRLYPRRPVYALLFASDSSVRARPWVKLPISDNGSSSPRLIHPLPR